MQIIIRTLTVIFLSLVLAGNLLAADMDKANKAYKAGDYATALKEWKPLAERGDANAQNNLGSMYHNGKGVKQDFMEAVKWYTLAANQGSMRAQANLGLMYEDRKDYILAYAWYSIAAANGSNGAAKNRDIIKKRMTQSQIEQAEAKAEELERSIKANN